MGLFDSLVAGGIGEVAKGVGSLAKDIRTAITGQEPMTAEQKADILARADALEAAGQALEAQASKGQIDLNILDSQSGSIFKGGWRPALGWVCVFGLGYTFLLRPLLPWTIQVIALIVGATIIIPEMPALDVKELISLVLALLGFGGFRMYEKLKGVS